METSPTYGLTMIAILIVVHAIIGGIKTALETVSRVNVKKRAEDGEPKAIRLEKVLQKRKRYLTVTDLVCIITLFATGVIYHTSVYGALSAFMDTQSFVKEAGIPGVVWEVLVLVCLICVFELFGIKLPKKLAHKNAEKYALSMVNVIWFFNLLLLPVAELLEAIIKGLLNLFGAGNHEEENVTEEEIISIVNEGHEQGLLEAEEVEMISNIIDLDEKLTKDIMTHRKKVIALDADMPLDTALNCCLEANYSRFPVYEANIDNVLGILHIKDLIAYYMQHKNNPSALRNIKVTAVMRESYFVPDTQTIDALFRDMQKKKTHMAVVVDEYGQTAGIVSMEDVLEEIVGDIQDEYDDEEAMIVPQEDGSLLVRGEADLEELFEELDVETEEEFDTVNGFLIAKLDWMPTEEEEYPVYKYEAGNVRCSFEILKVKDKLIDLVHVTKKVKKVTEQDDVEEEVEASETDLSASTQSVAKEASEEVAVAKNK